ncbi:hypothetical protein [Pseudonocardia sp. NPDC049635]|uniref:hypothetical protein n=1 Tax=Pseudonocardia sp. NPDC049635 TaxID=3155506 RepID=UPI003402DB30
MTRPACVCGCPADHHEHYRPGTDCGTCGQAVCPRYDTGRGHAGMGRVLAVAVGAPGLMLVALTAGLYGTGPATAAAAAFVLVTAATIAATRRA